MKSNKTTRGRTLDGLKAYPSRLYDGINLNWLILLSVGVLEEKGVDLSFENIVVAAFRLFPKKFSLLGYPEHPDANRIRAALVLRCAYKNRQWLLGTISQGFAFTERGRQELELAKQALQEDYLPIKKTFSKTRRFEKLLGEVRASPAYAKYFKGERDRISEAECCHVLQGTLDSDRRVLLDNLTKLREMATSLEQKDLVGFMDWLGQRFARFLQMGEEYGKVRHTG